MKTLSFILIILSLVLMAAHFLRVGIWVFSVLCLLLPFLLFLKRPITARIFQAVLFLSALEWIRTIYILISHRIDAGQDWIRSAIILGAVTLFTLGAACVFFGKNLKSVYKI